MGLNHKGSIENKGDARRHLDYKAYKVKCSLLTLKVFVLLFQANRKGINYEVWMKDQNFP